ncbi:photosystem II reaction center protein Ycf12/Psb30 [Microcoleus sp. FACHB-672]|nr:photosystem II reaction center protein Ycf12 [Microcoleus sp. FACHB-672]MBD2043884.1 photosystem II reaction center protein Ycf12 [Microcoleus sp. FACHB-672]
MDFLTSFVSNVNWEAIFQLTFVALIMLSGPIVIFLLAARGGDM